MTNSILRYSKLFALVALSALAAACGDDDDDNGGNPPPGDNRIVTVNGNVTVFPPAAAVISAVTGTAYDPGDVSNLQVRLATALAELNQNNTTFLGNSPQPLTDAAALNATFSVANVDMDVVASNGIAIIAHLEPGTGGTPVQTHRVTTGILLQADVPAGDLPATFPIPTGPPPDGNGAPAFILPAAFENALAAEVELTPADLVAADAGYILGFVTDGAAAKSGATVVQIRNAVGTDILSEYTVLYPNFATPTPGDGTATDATGTVVIFRTDGQRTTAPVTIVAQAGATTHGGQAGIAFNTAFIAPLTPQ